MKHLFLNRKIISAALVSCLVLFAGCMDLFDDEEAKVKIVYETETDDGSYAVLKADEFTFNTTASVSFADIPVRDGYTFAGWKNISENLIYTAGDDVSFVIKNDLILRAYWEENGLDFEIDWSKYEKIQNLLGEPDIVGENNNIVKFTAPTGYSKYEWRIDGETQPVDTNVFEWNTSEKAGIYLVTLEVTDANGETLATSKNIEISKWEE